MVTDREAVRIETTELALNTTFRVRVADGELKKLIGGQGRTARSLRFILTCIAKEHGQNFVLVLDDNESRQTLPSLQWVSRFGTKPLR